MAFKIYKEPDSKLPNGRSVIDKFVAYGHGCDFERLDDETYALNVAGESWEEDKLIFFKIVDGKLAAWVEE